jgi:hypothetical protein
MADPKVLDFGTLLAEKLLAYPRILLDDGAVLADRR